MRVFLLTTILGMLAAAQQTALWVPDCGDNVLMLGTRAAEEFKGLNTLSVTDINTILAFHTYTVLYESNAPAGFTWLRGHLVKDPPPQYTITTCTTPFMTTSSAVTSPRTTPTSAPSTITQVETSSATITTPAETATFCYPTGESVTDTILVLNQVLAFCGSLEGLATQSRTSSTVMYGGLQMLLQDNQANCKPGSEPSYPLLGVSFGSPFRTPTSSPTGIEASKTPAFNGALWPCLGLYNIWEFCNERPDGGEPNEGRGGTATIGCTELRLKPVVL